MTVGSDIKDEEMEAIEQLRKRVKDITEPELYDDIYVFYRFLKARDFNIDNAETMFKNHLEYRKKHDYKNILKFKKCEVMAKYIPNIHVGFDKEGNVIRFCPVGNLDSIGFHKSCKFDDILKFLIFESESETVWLKTQSKKLGRNVDKCIYIYDLKNLSFAQATDKKGIFTVFYILTFYQNNYPERLKAAFILNASTYFHMMFATMKGILAKSILSKIHIYSDDSYKKDLLNMIDADVLPAKYGGTRTDPDGNPDCLSFMNYAGKIPESYYIDRSTKSLAKAPGVKKVTLSRAAFHEEKIEVKEPDSYLEWEFETKSRDIGFGLFYEEIVDGEEKITEIIPIQRIDTAEYAETGTFKCLNAGTYVAVFDNTYSWIRAKDIFYRIKVVTPKEYEARLEE